MEFLTTQRKHLANGKIAMSQVNRTCTLNRSLTSSSCVQSPKHIFGAIYSNNTRQQECNCKVKSVGDAKVRKVFQ